ncbi:MAG TPA: hypothetical protein VIM70_05345 [Clostridium sp.]|uniref:hypothetical protein n=1 Tax=Clostridium sp. TaxID=1506 RepID=UPI002F93D6DD
MCNENLASNKLKSVLPNLVFKEDLPSLSKKDFCKELLGVIQIEGETISEIEIENIISNYIFVSERVRNDLREIDKSLAELKSLDAATLSDEDYKHKKYRYFAGLNKNAKTEIIDFYSDKLIDFVVENKSYKYVERKDDKLTMLFLDGRYEYAHFKRYFDFKHDFSTEAKIRFIPGIELVKVEKTVNEYIKLKVSSFENYKEEIARMVTENHCIEYVRDKVSSNHYLSRRIEIFDTLVELFNEKKYQAFVAIAVIQLEGVFYDCCSIMAKKELGNKAGTLVEKVEKVFRENRVMELAVYPYFAFDVPDLRNEVAHNGIILGKELQTIANEIILDLYSIVYWACRLSNDKYISLMMTMDKINETPDADEEQVIGTLFCELFSCYQISNREFIDVLKSPENYQTEIGFYKPPTGSTTGLSLVEAVTFLSSKVKSEVFWKFIKQQIDVDNEEHTKGKPYDFIDFVIQFKNEFILILGKGTPEKIACQEVAKLLRPFEDADKTKAGE